MISTIDKFLCCGCSSCVQRCPKQCISLKEDKEGFLYPIVDDEICIDCGLCEKVCPVLNLYEERLPYGVYAVKHKNDEIRMASSSGGVFTLLAEQVLDEGGVVFGARFDECWEVMHDYTETREGLTAFRGSKYVQSRIGNSYKQAEKFLREGRKVMFTGTPCQIAGLKSYLRKEYDNLLAVDFVCHGVPSPKVWRIYLKEITNNHCQSIKYINFRDKRTGWKNYSVSIIYTSGTTIQTPYFENIFMKEFLSDFCLRPSCYQCVYKLGKSGADITMGDFWGIEKVRPDLDDDKGCGLVLDYLNYNFTSLPIDMERMDYENAKAGNPAICNSARMPINRNFFWHRLEHNASAMCTWNEITSLKPFFRLYRKFYQILNK